MKIGEIALKSGIRPSAIRFYETAGVLTRASRQNGQRHFAADAERQLAVIEFARKAGFTIAEIRLLFRANRVTAPERALFTMPAGIIGIAVPRTDTRFESNHRQHRAISAEKQVPCQRPYWRDRMIDDHSPLPTRRGYRFDSLRANLAAYARE